MNKIVLNVFSGISFLFMAASAGAYQQVPSYAEVGKCYTKARLSATYKVVNKRVLAKPASYKIVRTPARYRWVDRTVIVQPASERVQVIPAKYKTIRKRVKVANERTRVIRVPAQYTSVPKRVMISPARKVWRKGRGAVEKIDDLSGDILCLVEEPAVYRTVYERKLLKPASSRISVTPAQYRTVTKRVLSSEARAKIINVPAITRVVKQKELVSAAYERQVPVPAQYRYSRVKVIDRPATDVWETVVCKKKITKPLISRIQTSLSSKGYYAGDIDGAFNLETKTAIRKFQSSSRIAAANYLTEETLNSLGVASP